MSNETDQLGRVFDVHGTIEFGEPVDRERARIVLEALGTVGIKLTLADGELPDESAVSPEEPPDRLINMSDMLTFARQNSIRLILAVQAWQGLAKAHGSSTDPSNIALGLRYGRPDGSIDLMKPDFGRGDLSFQSLLEFRDALGARLASLPPAKQARVLHDLVDNNVGLATLAFLDRFIENLMG